MSLPYCGIGPKLIIALDVGTTFSGVSYSILEPGLVPEIKGVNRFPAQERVGGDSKIPSVLYYDDKGSVCAIGAEATKEGIEVEAEEQGWEKAEWFKLHLRPRSFLVMGLEEDIPDLPRNKTAVDVFADYLKYLYRCTLTYICDTHSHGATLLESVKPTIEFILTHPNAWEGEQQSQMRKAAVRAGLVSDIDDGNARIHFVTEGEAGLHFCIRNGLITEATKVGEGVMVIDAGGGTVDLSAYSSVLTSKARGFSFQEIVPSKCLLQGSIIVTRNAMKYLNGRLQHSAFLEEVDHISSCFDKTTKLRFRSINEPQYIKFGMTRDKDHKFDIRSGQLKLSGQDVASFFEPCIQSISQAIVEQSAHATQNIKSIFLVGGFAASDWLFTQLKLSFEPLGFNLCRPDSHLNKAVANGAISYYIDHFVTARVSKHTYGTQCYMLYNPANEEHMRRSSSVFVDADGEKCIPSIFSPILKKGTQVKEVTEFREKFFRKAETLDSFPNPMTDDIICYRGHNEDPQWIDNEGDMFPTLCTVITDIPRMKTVLRPRRGKEGKTYYYLEYEIILSFGLTELKAQVCWKYFGREQRSTAQLSTLACTLSSVRSPAKIVYDKDAPEVSTTSG